MKWKINYEIFLSISILFDISLPRVKGWNNGSDSKEGKVRNYRWNSRLRRKTKIEGTSIKARRRIFLILFKRERRRLITVPNRCFLETNRDKLQLERSAYRESRSGLYTGITMFAKRRRQIFLRFIFFFSFLLKEDSKKRSTIKLIAKVVLITVKNLFFLFFYKLFER